MKKFKIFRLVLCVCVLALTSSRALAAPVNVNVVSPLPLPVEGSVSVSNLPTTQQISGTVTVSNLPSVSGTVTVGNTTSSPVPTLNVGGGAATHVGQPASNLVNLLCVPPPASQAATRPRPSRSASQLTYPQLGATDAAAVSASDCNRRSRSNCANESSTLSLSRPIEVVVLN